MVFFKGSSANQAAVKGLYVLVLGRFGLSLSFGFFLVKEGLFDF